MKDTDLGTPGIQIPKYSYNPMDPVSAANASAAFANDVDLSTWDAATVCGSCHIGGSVVEFDRNGVRHSQRPLDYAAYNADQNYVLELFDDVTGLPIHYDNPFNPAAGTSPGFGVAYAMWSMPGTYDNKFTLPDGSNAVVPSMFVNTTNGFPADAMGWAPQAFIDMGMAVDGQMMMPNVREMDCFFCHLSDFNNIISSVAVQMGYLNAAPSLSSGLMNMFTQTYMPGTTVPTGAPVPAAFAAFGQPVKLSASFQSRLNGEPKQENCRQCHTPTTMENFSAMFDEFLAAAPMDYNPASPNASLINGMHMPDYDLNAPFVPGGSFSPEVFPTPTGWEYGDNSSAAGPYGLFPMALDMSTFNPMAPAAAGGNKPGMSGPLYYVGGMTDQNANKKATIPFPRADFFKRGDLWDNVEQEVHFAFGCAGCHYNTEITNEDLTQCDPGRGRTRMGGVESAQTLGIQDVDGIITPQPRKGIDTHDTVKSCKQCHLTGKNTEGKAIETFGAPNPNAKHADAGLLAAVTTARGLDASGAEIDVTGSNHMDVIDCSVCHIYKEAMTVRSLDSTSGNRYPAMIGYQAEKGMMAMFTDPMYSDDLPNGMAYGIVSQNMGGMGATQAYVDSQVAMVQGMLGGASQDAAARFMLKNPQQVWQPIYGWHANMPKYLPLADGTPGNSSNGGAVNPDWRRVLVPINFIVAQMFDDSHDGAASDGNGDNAETNPLVTDPANSIKWDPPISRDMKAGMNFGAGPFGTIPVGFGGSTYASAYNMDFTFSGQFQFVGVYGGNIMLTTPEELSGYKTYREQLFTAGGGVTGPAGTNRSWANTQLVFQGGNPFQVTHNVVDTDKFAKGKKVGATYGCDDCHGPEVRDPMTNQLLKGGFFSGQYDMTGSGVPAQNMIDLDGPGTDFTAIDSNMMMRPVVDFEVVALAADLRTGSEAKDKTTGAVLDVEFEQHGCWDKTVPNPLTNGYTMGLFTVDGGAIAAGAAAGTNCGDDTVPENTADYVQTTDLDKSHFLYPGLTQAQAQAKAAVLEAIVPATYGIGVDLAGLPIEPTVTAATATGGNIGTYYEANAGTAVAITPATQTGFTYNTYFQNITDGSDTGVTVTGGTMTFPAAGTYRVVTEATNVEGKLVKDVQYVVVAGPLVGDFAAPTSTGVGNVTLQLASSPGTYDSVLVNWADGTAQDFYTQLDPLTNDYPAAMSGQVVRVNVAFYNGTDMVAAWATDVTVP